MSRFGTIAFPSYSVVQYVEIVMQNAPGIKRSRFSNDVHIWPDVSVIRSSWIYTRATLRFTIDNKMCSTREPDCTMDKPETHILIVGAGIGGLVLAQVLRKNNVSFEIFERDRDAHDRLQGWSIALHSYV